MIPQRLGDIIFNVLGDSSAQIRIMLVLCGTKEDFFISGKWMEKRTGLSQHPILRPCASLSSADG